MYICICNAFSDKKVKAHLESQEGTARVAEVYHACSGGQKPQCCSCLQTLKEIVQVHNNTVTA